MFRPLLLATAGLLALSACDRSNEDASVSINADGGNVLGAINGETGEMKINVPGFRRGKVPPRVIDRQVGRGVVLDEAINEALPKLYVQALQENDLQPLAQPEIYIT